MNGIPWWYFHALPGRLEGRRLPRIDPDDVLWRAVGPERAIGGVVYAASAVTAPGVIDVEQPRSRVVFGEPDGRLSDRAEALAALFAPAASRRGLARHPHRDLEQADQQPRRRHPGGAGRRRPARRLCRAGGAELGGQRVMEEAAAVAEALGVAPEPQLRDSASPAPAPMDHKPSILQDLELGRTMEIDGMFDAPLELARLAGVDGADAGTAGGAGEGAGARRGAVRGLKWKVGASLPLRWNAPTFKPSTDAIGGSR